MKNTSPTPRRVKAAVLLDNHAAQALAAEAGLLLALLAQPPERNLVALSFGRLRDGRAVAVARWIGFSSPADCGWAAAAGPRRFVEAWSAKVIRVCGMERLRTVKPENN